MFQTLRMFCCFRELGFEGSKFFGLLTEFGLELFILSFFLLYYIILLIYLIHEAEYYGVR